MGSTRSGEDLRARFHRDKVFIVGHSWGTVLGLWLAHEHPEAVVAYVGELESLQPYPPTDPDRRKTGIAQISSLEILIPQVNNLNVSTFGTDFRVPVFFFQGRLDPYCRPALLDSYVRTITAPRREVVPFERAGHFPYYEERERFAAELARVLTPS